MPLDAGIENRRMPDSESGEVHMICQRTAPAGLSMMHGASRLSKPALQPRGRLLKSYRILPDSTLPSPSIRNVVPFLSHGTGDPQFDAPGWPHLNVHVATSAASGGHREIECLAKRFAQVAAGMYIDRRIEPKRRPDGWID